MDALGPNWNFFFVIGSSALGAAVDEPPNGLLAPKAGVAPPNTGATVELDVAPKAGGASAVG